MPTTAPTMTRENFAELLTPIHKKIFFDAYGERPLVYKKIFKTEKMNAKTQSYPHLGAFGLWAENQEGNEFNQDKFDQGQVASFTARRFDKAYDLTWELVQDDLYNVMKGIGQGGSAKGLGRSLRATEETDTANVIMNGFSNIGYDGKSLFATDHPLINSNKVCSNLVNGMLTDETLKQALTLMRLQLDEAGVPIAARASQLVVCPELEFIAKAIVHSILQSGTNNNDVNTIPNLEVVVWDNLSDPAGYMKPWFVQDTSIDNLLFLRREEPIFGSKQLQRKMDYNMYGYTRFDTGYCDWRGLVGSMGVQQTIITPDNPNTPSTPDTPTTSTGTTFQISENLSMAYNRIDGIGETMLIALEGQAQPLGTLKMCVNPSVAPQLEDEDGGYSEITLGTPFYTNVGDTVYVVDSVEGKIKAIGSFTTYEITT